MRQGQSIEWKKIKFLSVTSQPLIFIVRNHFQLEINWPILNIYNE